MLPTWVGSLSRGKLGLRVVVSSTTERTHQPVGDESSSFGLVSFQSNSPSQISGSGNRQYYRSSLSEKPERHSLFQPVFSLQGDSPSLLGSSQCTSRHTVTFSSTSEHGMGITTSNFQCHQSSLGSSSSGSVCYVSEPQAGHFRFPSSRSSSTRCRRNVNLLERNVCLRIPSLQVSFPSPSKGVSGILQDHSYCTGLAKTSLVHRSAASLVCKTTSSSSQSESTVSAERKNTASKSREPASARMVTLRKGLRQKGFSVRATNHISKAVRQSTEIVYDAKWSIFVYWCVGREIDPIKVSVQQLAYYFCTSF